MDDLAEAVEKYEEDFSDNVGTDRGIYLAVILLSYGSALRATCLGSATPA